MYVCTYIRTYVHTYVYMYVYMYLPGLEFVITKLTETGYDFEIQRQNFSVSI